MTKWLADMLVATSLLMAAVLIVRPLVRQLFGAGAAYALWLVPALRLILPPLDLSSPGLSTLDAIEIVRVAVPASPTATPWLFMIWATGAAGFALWQLLGYQSFLRRALSGALVGYGDAFVTGAVAGPAAVGLLVPRILLPLDFHQRFSPAERVLAVAHERAHLVRGDLWANAAALAMLCLHWFNPLAWAAYSAFRSDQELSCDAAVIGGAGAEQRAAYAAAMVKSAQPNWGNRAAPPFTCPMSRTGNLVRRLKMLKTHRKSAWAKAGGLVTVGATALAGLTMTAAGAIAADPVVKTERIIVKRVQGQDSAETAIAAFTKGKCTPANTSMFKVGDAGDGGVKQTRFIMCSKDGAPGGDRLTALQKARARIADSGDVDAESKAKVLKALDGAIAQTKAAN